MDKTPLMIPHLPMKDMDGTMLTLAINEYVSQMSPAEQALMNNAMALAAYLHRKDTRMSATRATNGEHNQPTTPYIVHPLRNTLRLLRWGVTDAQILAASLLHDVVEDHPREIVREFTDVDVQRRDKEQMRKVAVEYLAKTFGANVAHLVRAVSNPILSHDTPREVRNSRYLAHVEHAIRDPRVFLVKAADLNDNSLSLHHSFEPTDVQATRRAAKYLPAMQVVLDTLKVNYEAIAALTSPAGIKQLEDRFAAAEEYLRRFIAS